MIKAKPSQLDWVPLLVPDMPAPDDLMPWLERIHNARHYTNFGPLVNTLESRFAENFGVAQEAVTTVANATLGLELVLQALHLPKNAKILLPAFTFVATATAVLRAGYQPVLADVDANSWLLTPAIAHAAHAQTRIDAVMPVAAFGMPHNMREWQQFELETGLPVVIDAAAAYGSQWCEGEGTLVFSLHATKSLPAGEGGLVVSTRPGLAAEVRRLSNFGIQLQHGSTAPVGALVSLGTNAKMSEYHAAIGLASLQKWEQKAKERQVLYAEIAQRINHMTGNALVWQKPGNGGVVQAPTLLCACLPDASIRRALEQACQQARIMTRRWYQPLLLDMEALRQCCLLLDAPNARVLGQTLLGLPFFLGITQTQQARIEAAINKVMDLF